MIQQKPRILIVDDDTTLRELYGQRLAMEDFEVITADDGASGITKATEIKPDVILLDIMMPNIDGYKVASILKEDERTKNIPIVFLTALFSEDQKQKAMAMGAKDFIVKSDTMPSQIVAKIREILHR